MRGLIWVALAILLPDAVLALPEPPPAGDYPGSQYIDRAGCVYIRQGNDWTQRRDGEGAPICGFPPSQSAMTAVPDMLPPSPEAVLTDVLAQGLRSGDLATDPQAVPLATASPDSAQAELDSTVATQLEADIRLRSALAGDTPNGLCARLGYRDGGNSAPIPGGDVTQGLCSGMTAANPAPRISAPVAIDQDPPATVPDTPAPLRAEPRPAAPSMPSPVATAGPASVVARRPAAHRVQQPTLAEMIPAHARYVQIGLYEDEGNALAALRRLSGLGFRTAQKHETYNGGTRRAILAGPFTDRQALVSALSRLRADGYPRATAR